MDRQNTVKKDASFSGIALHTGARAVLRVLPAPENTGIVFRRIDLPNKPEVRALVSNVVDVRRGTTIADGEAMVYTVEHVMATFHAFGIDNAYVEMDGPEPPIGDGSSLPYVEMVKSAGINPQNAGALYWTSDKTISFVEENGTEMILVPSDRFRVTCFTSFGVTAMDTQFYSSDIDVDIFAREICGARTFVPYRDLKQLLAMGLVKGGSLDSAVILHDNAIISKEGLRYPNEIARHKALDITGDMYLAGMRVKAHVIAVKPGHPSNVRMAGEMLKKISQLCEV